MVPDPSYSATSELSRWVHGSTVQVQMVRDNHPVRLTVVVILDNCSWNALELERKSPIAFVFFLSIN